MNRQQALKIINPLLALLIISQALTGILHNFLPYTIFSPLHIGGGWLLLLCVGIHVWLNWGWIKANFKKRK